MKPSHEIEAVNLIEERLRGHYLNEKLRPVIEENRKARQESAMSERIELGAIEFAVEVKNGDVVLGSQEFQILQNNMPEVGAQVPDGKYKWVLILDLKDAKKD